MSTRRRSSARAPKGLPGLGEAIDVLAAATGAPPLPANEPVYVQRERSTRAMPAVMRRIAWEMVAGLDADRAAAVETEGWAAVRRLKSPTEHEIRIAFGRARDKVVSGDQPAAAPAPPGPGAAVARRWASASLAEFAAEVRRVADGLDGWPYRLGKAYDLGSKKVFIHHIFRAAPYLGAVRGESGGVDESVFKERLVQANRARLLELARADLVQAMKPEDVRDSETNQLNATFHFVRLDEKDRPTGPSPERAAAKLDRMAAGVVADLTRDGRAAGIREVTLAVEKALGQETPIDQIHQALARVADLYPGDDVRQRSYGYRPPGARDPLIWVGPKGSTAKPPPAATLKERIRAAYLRVTGGALNKSVRLAQLRAELGSDDRREDVDEALREFQREQCAVLYPIDDPQRIRAEDNAAAMRVAGERRDLFCITR